MPGEGAAIAGGPCSVPAWLRPLVPVETEAQRAACRRHDDAYGRGGARADRLRADWTLGVELVDAGMDPDRAELYVHAVRMYGGPRWFAGDAAGAVLPPEPGGEQSP